MIKGLLSHLSSAGKLSLLLALILSFLLISSLLGFLLLMPSLGTGVIDILAHPDYSDPATIRAMKFLQILNMATGLLLPSVIYLVITEKDPLSVIRTPQSGGMYTYLLVVILFIAVQPLIGLTNEWNSRLVLPSAFSGLENWMKASEKQALELTNAFLSTSSFSGLLLNIFMIALLPAVAEELLFRGILARLLKRWTGSIHWAVLISSLVFAAIHLQFYGFLPRFLLGAGLAYLYFLTGNLWVPILAHFVNNLLSVITEYLYKNELLSVKAENAGYYSNTYIIVLSLCISIVLVLTIRRVILNEQKD